jgi:hypothetical protein
MTKSIADIVRERRSRMATFMDLQKANQQIATTNIKGKEYAEVNQRIKAFRMVYPEGYINTAVTRLQDGMCVVHAECGYTVIDASGMPHEITLGSGIAYEMESSSFINKTSYIENCETSAVGRALGMAGFGIDTSVCSAEELSNAQLQQEANEPIKKNQVKMITDLANKVGSDIKDICGYFNVESIEEMTAQDYGKCLIMLKKKEEQQDEQQIAM